MQEVEEDEETIREKARQRRLAIQAKYNQERQVAGSNGHPGLPSSEVKTSPSTATPDDITNLEKRKDSQAESPKSSPSADEEVPSLKAQSATFDIFSATPEDSQMFDSLQNIPGSPQVRNLCLCY
jgi:hypothetical protein